MNKLYLRLFSAHIKLQFGFVLKNELILIPHPEQTVCIHPLTNLLFYPQSNTKIESECQMSYMSYMYMTYMVL